LVIRFQCNPGIIKTKVRIRFITSTPLDIRRGSGTYVGMHVLARALGELGHTVEFDTPSIRLPVYTAKRLIFNRFLRPSADFDLTVGFDMDGYRIAGSGLHAAALKGVIADEARFESGMTRLTMSVQARCERLHVERAGRVLVTSRYSAERVRDLYDLDRSPAVVPEPIGLAEWRRLLETSPAQSEDFTVLFVGRFYRRKRVDVLLRAAAALKHRIAGLAVRIVGAGPMAAPLHRLADDLGLGGTVTWLGDVSRPALAAEYNRADVFCLPSVQEAFGIVLLEAMAAARPIVAARAGAIPEVAPNALLVEPDSYEALAAGIEELYRCPERRSVMGRSGALLVERYDARTIAQEFLEAAAGAAPGRAICSSR
jgi:glycosyltransferase involved in cell wall biosynthesis